MLSKETALKLLNLNNWLNSLVLMPRAGKQLSLSIAGQVRTAFYIQNSPRPGLSLSLFTQRHLLFGSFERGCTRTLS